MDLDAYFGILGANKYLNVLYGSPLFDDLLADIALEPPFLINEKIYAKGYYLADEIYRLYFLNHILFQGMIKQ